VTDNPANGSADSRATNPMLNPFAGLELAQGMFEGPLRYQAGLAAAALRRFNGPILDTLARHREFAESLAAAAEQMAAIASRVEQLASQHAALTDQLQAALEPYLKYVDHLGDLATGGRSSQA
jgi:ABC-type transporter Mla subunit MlaD